jgi:hypothetical protein
VSRTCAAEQNLGYKMSYDAFNKLRVNRDIEFLIPLNVWYP